MRPNHLIVMLALAAPTAALAQTPATAATSTAPTPAASTAAIAVPAPPEGKGQVVFFRGGGMGFAMGCGVNENGARVSALGAGRYFIQPATVGSHTYSVKSEAKDVLIVNVDAGSTSYVRCTIKMGIMVGRPNLTLSTAEDFAKASGKLKPVDADDMGPVPAKS